MAEFGEEDLSGSTFDWTDLSGSTFRAASLSNVTIRGTDLHHVKMSGVELWDVDITGEIQGLRINGVDVTDYVEQEVLRREPDLARMRPDDPAGFREAWDLVERRWDGTVERARGLDPELLHEQVDGEWSFVETLRHLSFATAAWVGRAIEGDPAPWHPLDLPWDEAPEGRGFPRDRSVRPSLDEVLEVRRARQSDVRHVVEGLTAEVLASEHTPPDDEGWPPARPFSVKDCLSIVLNEEWWHRTYAERDLAVLETRST
ncbi:DinB family protein [Nocardioides sp.]|uniref:DinB family protein n=1 Tax=Nocardioides sp. TaxID=35761 RepID=UPI00286C806B|nr:DinB family protein [Nocardioides sp.]